MATVKLRKTKATAKTTKVTKKTAVKAVKKPAKKTASDKLNLKLAKLEAVPEFLKVSTQDFLDLLASNLERGDGVGYASERGLLTVKPKSPKDLANTVKYLRKQAVK